MGSDQRSARFDRLDGFSKAACANASDDRALHAGRAGAGQHRSSSPYNTIQDTFGDGAGELPYVDISVDYSDSFLVNEWNVTRQGSSRDIGLTQTRSDATSI